MRLSICLLLAVTASAQDGDALYERHCSACHDKGVGRAPRRDALKRMSPESVLAALTNGTMTSQGRVLNAAEIRSVSTFVTGKSFGSEGMPARAFCGDRSAAFDNPFAGPYWNGWGVNPTNQRSQPLPMAGLNADQIPRLKLKRAFGFPGVIRAFAQPAVAGGSIFIGTEARKVYSLDAASGCVHWIFDAMAGVRSAISIGRLGTRWAAYFGDQKAYAYAVDAATGKLLWKTRVEEFPAAVITGSPTLHGETLYVPVSLGRRSQAARRIMSAAGFAEASQPSTPPRVRKSGKVTPFRRHRGRSERTVKALNCGVHRALASGLPRPWT